jgi:predicted CXXCH cytochrome family protein
MIRRLAPLIIIISVAVMVYAMTKRTHDFEYGECAICHPSVRTDPSEINPDITGSCQVCHDDLNEIQMHPTDITPRLSIPRDMPLLDGRMTCLTCHYVHPERKKQFVKRDTLLRRQVRGQLFCSICHNVDDAGHVVLEEAHTGVYEELNPDVKIDFLSLSCLKCHEKTIDKEELNSIGAGMWRHPENARINHPIGIDYREFSSRKGGKDYLPADGLELKLYDGKIGCGTCHSITSRRWKLLVMEETELCRKCHNR